MLSTSALTQLRGRVLSEAQDPRKTADLIYLVGQTANNESSVLDAACEFTGPIGLIGHHSPTSGYPGFAAWRDGLAARGIPTDRLRPIHGALIEMGGNPIIHTLSEAEALVEYAKDNQLKDIVLIVPYFHILRAFMTVVLVVSRTYPLLRVWPALGRPLPWDEVSTHSQGVSKGIRADFVFDETVRIFAYHAQGNIPDPELVLDYMQTRQP